jgi:hypothetical protein
MRMTGPCDWRRSRLLPSGSRSRASPSTARRLCSALTACHGSKSCAAGRLPHAAILYAFDLIERDGENMRNRPFLDRKAALARLLRNTGAGILFNEHIAEDGHIVFAHACRLGAEGIVSKKVDGTYHSGPCRVWIKVRNPPASPRSASGPRFGIDEPQAARAEDDPPARAKSPRRSQAQMAASRARFTGLHVKVRAPKHSEPRAVARSDSRYRRG